MDWIDRLRGMPVLVAGAGGFIGGHLATRLVQAGAEVRGVDIKPVSQWYQRHEAVEAVCADLMERDVCMSVTDGMAEVYNLAADMGGMGFIENNKASCMLSVLESTHMLMAAQQCGVRRFFYASSACVYAAEHQRSPNVTALKESDAYPAEAEDGYGWEKLFSERMCRHFFEDFGLETRVARYHNVYGPHGTWEGGREKAPAAICRKVAEAVFSDTDTIEIWGDGQQTRSFMYIDDCVEGTLRLMASDVHEPINIGSSELVTVNQLVDMIEAIADAALQRRYDLTAPQGVRGRNSDNELVRQLLGWEPTISLEEGLTATYKWVSEQVAMRRVGLEHGHG